MTPHSGPVLVLGGTGCAGRAIARDLRLAGWAVITAARGLNAGPTPDVAVDRRQPGALAQAVAATGPAAVVDCVAFDGADVQALEDCVGPEVPVILLSSAAVYGPARPAAYAEVDPPQPTGPLGQGKRIAEQALRAGARRTALRLGLLYGPGHLPLTPTGRHPDGLQRLRHGRSIPTPRGATLQPLASRDLGGLVRRLLADPTPPRLLNVAGPVSVGWRGWLGAWAHALGCPVPACVPTSRAALVAAATPALAAFIHALLSPPQLDRRTLDGYHPGPWTSLTEGVAEAAAALAAPELRAVEPAAGGPDSGGPEGPAGRR